MRPHSIAPPSSIRRVKKACVSSSAIPSWWSTQPSRVTLRLRVRSPTRVYSELGVPLDCRLSTSTSQRLSHAILRRGPPRRRPRPQQARVCQPLLALREVAYAWESVKIGVHRPKRRTILLHRCEDDAVRQGQLVIHAELGRRQGK